MPDTKGSPRPPLGLSVALPSSSPKPHLEPRTTTCPLRPLHHPLLACLPQSRRLAPSFSSNPPVSQSVNFVVAFVPQLRGFATLNSQPTSFPARCPDSTREGFITPLPQSREVAPSTLAQTSLSALGLDILYTNSSSLIVSLRLSHIVSYVSTVLGLWLYYHMLPSRPLPVPLSDSSHHNPTQRTQCPAPRYITVEKAFR